MPVAWEQSIIWTTGFYAVWSSMSIKVSWGNISRNQIQQKLQQAAIIYLVPLFGIRGYIYSSFQKLIQMFLAAVQLSQKLNNWKTKFSLVASLPLRTPSKSFQKKLTLTLIDEINRGLFLHCKSRKKNNTKNCDRIKYSLIISFFNIRERFTNKLYFWNLKQVTIDSLGSWQRKHINTRTSQLGSFVLFASWA